MIGAGMATKRKLDRRRAGAHDHATESTRTVLMALGANAGVAVAKTAAGALSGSASMIAEAAHSWADTGNEVFLLIADQRSKRPPDARHPLGYGREAYMWSLLAAVGLFVAGAVVSVWHGVTDIIHGSSSLGGYHVAYLVLTIAFVMEAMSLRQVVHQLRGEAEVYNRDLLEHAMVTSDPTARAVFAEDSAAVIGIALAFGGIGLHQLTGNALWDSVASILIGILLGVIAVILIDRNRRFIAGEAGSSELREAMVARIESLPDVAAVRFVRLMYVGPRRLFLVASVDLAGDAPESHVAKKLRRLERELVSDPHIVDAVVTIADPDESDSN
jgi:cation diffusion facilitator family transporter